MLQPCLTSPYPAPVSLNHAISSPYSSAIFATQFLISPHPSPPTSVSTQVQENLKALQAGGCVLLCSAWWLRGRHSSREYFVCLVVFCFFFFSLEINLVGNSVPGTLILQNLARTLQCVQNKALP